MSLLACNSRCASLCKYNSTLKYLWCDADGARVAAAEVCDVVGQQYGAEQAAAIVGTAREGPVHARNLHPVGPEN